MRWAAVGALALALLAPRARAGEDPSDLEESPPEAAPPPQEPPQEAPPEAPPSRAAQASDPLLPCRALLLDERPDDAERCLRAALAAPDANPILRARARALLDLAGVWKKRLADAAPTPTAPAELPTPAPPPTAPPTAILSETLSIGGLVNDGTGEAVVHGTLAGGTAAFLVSATIASATRASEGDTIGYLVGAPAAGALLGAGTSYALVRLAEPSIGDLRLATSAMWMGVVQGFSLQLAVFDQSADVGAVPLRFLTVLAGGAVGLGAGTALGPLVEIEDGDVAVANSAALWGGVLTTVVLTGVAGSGVPMSGPVVTALVAAGIGVPWVGALAAHQLLDVDRWSAFLIDAGGAGGLLVSAAAWAAFSSSIGSSAAMGTALLTAGALAGLTVGTMAAVMTSDAVRTQASGLARDRRSLAATDEGVE